MKSVGNFTGRMVGGLGLWNVYFICKFFLTQLGYLRLELFANIALFCFLLLPANSKGMRFLKQLIALGGQKAGFPDRRASWPMPRASQAFL